MFFIVVDAHSKWPEVGPMRTTTAEKTVDVLMSIYIREERGFAPVVSDNGSQFVSEHFKHFMELNEVKHITSAPEHKWTRSKHSGCLI